MYEDEYYKHDMLHETPKFVVEQMSQSLSRSSDKSKSVPSRHMSGKLFEITNNFFGGSEEHRKVPITLANMQRERRKSLAEAFTSIDSSNQSVDYKEFREMC